MAEPKRLLVSFSGGETSAYMTWRILNDPDLRSRWDEILVVFANTSQENEETLDFVRNCDVHFGFGTVWLEAVTFHNERRSAGFRVVDFETACRDGFVFESMIQKYGIPNAKFKSCTRDLKQNPIAAYARSLGWGKPGDYDLAIGIRDDELDRVSARAHERRLIYPLAHDVPMTKPKINFWWSQQPFRLHLKHWQGNCKWCWKKSKRKHMTLIKHTPEVFDFPRRMERDYALVGPEFIKTPPPPEGYQRTFFRGNESVDTLFAQYAALPDDWQEAEDEAQVFDPEWDVGGGCGDSCEVWTDDE